MRFINRYEYLIGVGQPEWRKIDQESVFARHCQTVLAHDAHNVVVVGTNDQDIVRAVKELERMRGGQVAIANGKVEAALPLPIAGLVSDQPLETVIERISELNSAAGKLGCRLAAPFMTLSFLSLSPIPELKLTDQGLVDAVNMKLTSVIAD